MGSNPSRRPAEQERARRHRENRDRLQNAAEQLLSPEGWMRWVLARATLHGYSAANCMLLAAQCHERGIVPQRVGGLHSWRRIGRRVRKGETALRISAPVVFNERDEHGRETGKRRVSFKTAFVFELSQTEPLPGIEPHLSQPRCEPLSDSSHAHLLAPLRSFAESLGYSVSFQRIPDAARGWCDTQHRQMAVDVRAAANTQVRTLIHECVHALGIDYRRYPKTQAEVIADTVTYLACASVGLAIDTDSVPYVASWGKDGALEAVTDFAQTIDKLARRIEDCALRATSPA
jgi:antirestriction protein ArdC